MKLASIICLSIATLLCVSCSGAPTTTGGITSEHDTEDFGNGWIVDPTERVLEDLGSSNYGYSNDGGAHASGHTENSNEITHVLL